MNTLLLEKRAYSMTFWAIFIGIVIVPMMALSIEVARYWFARGQIAAAADAAAVAAAVEIDHELFRNTGEARLPNSYTYAWAQSAANQNCGWLHDRGVFPSVTGITITGTTVQVTLSANLEILFPAITPNVRVSETGKAEVRALKR